MCGTDRRLHVKLNIQDTRISPVSLCYPTVRCLNLTMKLAILALATGSAAAFAPAGQATSSTALNAGSSFIDSKAGGLPPLGAWDPLGLATTEAKFDTFRAVELKHGRVAQMAVLGYVVPEFYRFPGEVAHGVNFADVPSGVAALYGGLPPMGWVQIIMTIGFVETYGVLGDFEMGKPELSGETLVKRQTQELQHGRLAMLATMELLRHDWQNFNVPGFDGLDNLITGLPFLY
jgi:hypothetical protein